MPVYLMQLTEFDFICFQNVHVCFGRHLVAITAQNDKHIHIPVKDTIKIKRFNGFDLDSFEPIKNKSKSDQAMAVEKCILQFS